MEYSRRMFMKAGVLAAACAGLPLKSVLAESVLNEERVPTLREPTVIPLRPPAALNSSTITHNQRSPLMRTPSFDFT